MKHKTTNLPGGLVVNCRFRFKEVSFVYAASDFMSVNKASLNAVVVEDFFHFVVKICV